ncbi:MAG: SDR family NAD(P)-dependent oxidoreductase [Myxococcota bacterium]
MKPLLDRVAVVTGAGSGIGRALSIELAHRGCDLAVVDIDTQAAESCADEVRKVGRRASAHRVDVSSRAEMSRLPEQVIREHGHVHLLVNNAGVTVGKSFEEHTLEDFDWVVGVNFWGTVHGCRFFLPYLQLEHEAHIVNLSSIFGIFGAPAQTSYCATKFGIRGFSEALRAELSGTGVGVSVVHPGAIRTNIIRGNPFSDVEQQEKLARRYDRAAMSPERAAQIIVHGIEKGHLRILVGSDARVLDVAKRLFPAWSQTLLVPLVQKVLGLQR